MKAIDRLYIYLDSQNIKPTVFERNVGLSSGYLSKMKGRAANMGEDILNIVIDNCPLMSVEWLLNGKGDMLRKDKPYQEVSPPLDVVTEAGKKSTQQLCLLCQEKDKVIAAQQSQIDTQAEYIALLKEQSPQINGQKRKVP